MSLALCACESSYTERKFIVKKVFGESLNSNGDWLKGDKRQRGHFSSLGSKLRLQGGEGGCFASDDVVCVLRNEIPFDRKCLDTDLRRGGYGEGSMYENCVVPLFVCVCVGHVERGWIYVILRCRKIRRLAEFRCHLRHPRPRCEFGCSM
jgi:hypothetical protein